MIINTHLKQNQSEKDIIMFTNSTNLRDTNKINFKISAIYHVKIGCEINLFFMIITSLESSKITKTVVGESNCRWKTRERHLSPQLEQCPKYMICSF